MKRYIRAAILDIRDADEYSQNEVAEDINSPIDDIIKLADQISNWTAHESAEFTLKRLANSGNSARIFEGDPELRQSMICCCYDRDLLKIFAEDPDEAVRWRIAANHAASPEILDKLSLDSSAQIRAAVARHKNVPDYTLARLAKDESAFVRYHAAQNPKTPYAILLKLLNDDDSDVRESALENIESRSNSGG